MRPELDDTLAAPGSDPTRTTTLNERPTKSAAASSAGLVAGQQLGHFRIERKLGAGGMGEVYLATDLALDRPVAIKVLPDDLARDAGRRDRMIREARAQARVSHPNVGHIYFIGEEDGRLYFAMEYVAGTTLADRIASGPLPLDTALDVIRAAALGLREAQRSGFTHRDVKPSNLMIDGHGVTKVLDFGLAAGDPTAASDGPVAQTSLAGTPLYMAPEQARGEPVDFRADIYALGATLYHLVSGAPPFQADTIAELLTLHASAARPALPRSKQPRTSIAAIDALCAKMMAPAAADRFASYDELLHALDLASVAHTRPAGFWVRGMASGLDLLVSLIVLGLAMSAVSWFTGEEYVNGSPLLTLYAASSIVLWARFGRTLGQVLFELEIIDIQTGTRPTWKVAALRGAAKLGVPLALAWLSSAFDMMNDSLAGEITGIAAVAWFGVCALLLLHASARVHGKRTPWDRLSGTMVRYRTRPITAL